MVDIGNQTSEDYGLQLDEDQGATFGMFEIGGFDFHVIGPNKKKLENIDESKKLNYYLLAVLV